MCSIKRLLSSRINVYDPTKRSQPKSALTFRTRIHFSWPSSQYYSELKLEFIPVLLCTYVILVFITNFMNIFKGYSLNFCLGMVVSTLGQLMPLEINVKVSFQELIDLEEISSP